MILKINNLSINVVANEKELLDKIPTLFLHGFTGSVEDWIKISEKLPQNFSPILIDLIGHGKSDSPLDLEYYSFESQIDILHKIIQHLRLENLIIVGYSMGGRMALSYAVKNSENIRALVLESTSFGLATDKNRKDRVKADFILSDYIDKSSIEDFIEYWINLPMFATLSNIPTERLNLLKQRKINSINKIGLKNSLKGFSTGKMTNYFPQLNRLNSQVLLVTGSLDLKFTQNSVEANKLLQNSSHQIVNDCGHNVHFEKPEEFLKLLNDFFSNI